MPCQCLLCSLETPKELNTRIGRCEKTLGSADTGICYVALWFSIGSSDPDED